ncbi:MAG: glycosyltransferase [Candidatus Margulisiibacteriota bacterium]
MRIGYDLLSACGVYELSLLEALFENYPDISQTALLPDKKNKKSKELSWLRREMRLPFKIASEGLDILFCPSPNLPLRQPCKTAVLISDLDRLIFEPHGIRGLENIIKWRVQKAAVKKANRIITYSRFFANHLSRLLNADGKRVAAIPIAASKDMFPVYDNEELSRVKKETGINTPYFIFAGGSSKRKSIKDLIEIFNTFSSSDPGIRLVLASDLPKDLSSQNIISAGFKNRDDLCALYSGALAYVSASSYEGFPFGAFESMCCGTPAVVFDNSSFGEILGNSALLVRNGDKAGFVKTLRQTAADPQLRLRQKALSIERSKSFSGNNSASAIMKIFNDILKESYSPDEK